MTQWSQSNPDGAKVHALVDTRLDAFRGKYVMPNGQ